MKKLITVLSIVLFTGCQAAKIPVCTSGCPRPETMASTLPESTRLELIIGTAVIGGLVILFFTSVENNKDDK